MREGRCVWKGDGMREVVEVCGGVMGCERW
jgi:hypothetical protein